jgi:hypothetical protein
MTPLGNAGLQIGAAAFGTKYAAMSANDPNRTLAGSKSRTATALTELRQSDMVPARLV